jgi:hypothetical protein
MRQMPASASPSQSSARDTLAALDQLRRDDELLVDSWRALVDAAWTRVARGEDDHYDQISLRAARALGATAATEAEQAARFSAALLRLAPERLAERRSALEPQIAALRERGAEAAADLDATVRRLMREFEQQLAEHALRDPSSRTRAALRFVDAVAGAQRAYRDRIEQLLLDLGEAAHSVFGLAIGGALPPRLSREPPPLELGDLLASDRSDRRIERVDDIWLSVGPYRDGLGERVDEAAAAIRARLDAAAACRARGPQAAHQRIRELTRDAQRLGTLAERLEWIV